MSFPIPTTTQPVELIEAIHPEPFAAVEATEIAPMSATITIAVAIASPCAHSQNS